MKNRKSARIVMSKLLPTFFIWSHFFCLMICVLMMSATLFHLFPSHEITVSDTNRVFTYFFVFLIRDKVINGNEFGFGSKLLVYFLWPSYSWHNHQENLDDTVYEYRSETANNSRNRNQISRYIKDSAIEFIQFIGIPFQPGFVLQVLPPLEKE